MTAAPAAVTVPPPVAAVQAPSGGQGLPAAPGEAGSSSGEPSVGSGEPGTGAGEPVTEHGSVGESSEEPIGGDPSSNEEPIVTEEPPVTEDPVTEEPVSNKEPTLTEEPASGKESTSGKEPTSGEEPASSEEPAGTEDPAGGEPATPFRFFSGSSFWNALVPANAALDPSSSTLIEAFNHEIVTELANSQVTINTTSWSVPVYTVPSTQPTVKVVLNKGTGSSTNPLQTAWTAVPLPPNAEGAKGHDKHLVVWQPSTSKMWEFWGFEKTASGPVAGWGGAMQGVLGDTGVYDTSAWPRLISNTSAWEYDVDSWGATATSLPVAGGLITLEDFERGQIDHALAMAIPKARAGVWSTPAQRTDGTSTEATSLPEGAHLRLDPSLQLSALKLPHTVLMLAEAAQRYGIVVRDKSANVAFYAQDPTPTGSNPYAGPHGYFEGKCPCKLLNTFPWSHLQVLKMELDSKG